MAAAISNPRILAFFHSRTRNGLSINVKTRELYTMISHKLLALTKVDLL